MTVKDLVIDNDKLPDLFLPILDKRIDEISTGTLRYLECIWVLNSKANFILLDEPFLGLSPLLIEQLQELILIKSKTKGIVLTDHIYKSLLQVSDRVVLMQNKSLYPIKDTEELSFYQYIP